MKIAFALITATVWLAMAWPARADMCDHIPLEMVTNQEGVTYAVYLSEVQIERTPTWNPEMGEPPLSVSRAYRLAMEWAHERYAKYDRVEIDAIALKPVHCYAYRDRWYVKVEFEPIIDGNKLYGIGNYVVILLDGTVIAPTKTRREQFPDEAFPPQPTPRILPAPGPNPI